MRATLIRPKELDASQIDLWRSITEKVSIYRSPFYAPEFTLAVGEARDDAFVAVLESDGETKGFFPFHRLRRGVAKPIGGPISDYHGPILKQGFDPDPIRLLEACDLASYDFNHLPTEIRKFSDHAYDRSRSPIIDLPNGYDGFVENPSKTTKNELRNTGRRRRKIEREIGPISFKFHDTSDAKYEQFISFKNQQFSALRVESAFDVPWIARTLELVRKARAPSFAGVFSTLCAGDRLLAAHFGMRSRTALHWWFPTYDRAAAAYGSGMVLLDEIARCAQQHGVTVIDLGRGDDPYKFKFKNSETQLCEGSVERRSTLPGVLRTSQKAFLSAARPLPLGPFESYPRRALARLISGMRLPS